MNANHNRHNGNVRNRVQAAERRGGEQGRAAPVPYALTISTDARGWEVWTAQGGSVGAPVVVKRLKGVSMGDLL